jgi:hypothetical protein
MTWMTSTAGSVVGGVGEPQAKETRNKATSATKILCLSALLFGVSVLSMLLFYFVKGSRAKPLTSFL